MEFGDLNLEEVDTLGSLEFEVIQKIKATMSQIYITWREIGIDKQEKVERSKVAWNHIQNLIQDIYEEEHGILEELKKQIIVCTENISELSRILNVEVNEITGIPLIKRAETLNRKLEGLQKLKDTRMQHYNTLRETEKYYCNLLNMKERKISSNAELLSEMELNELEQYIYMMKQEKIKRLDKYSMLVKQIIDIFEEIGLEPDTELEKHILSGKSPPDLSMETLEAVEKIMENAMERKTSLEKEKETLLDKLITLWDRLKIDRSIKMEFLSTHADYKVPTIKSIEQEIIRCEDLKLKNIKLFIESLREELKELWEKCGASDSEKGQFYQYFIEMTDDLAHHEKEVEKWKTYYKEVKPILENIEKKNQLQNLLMALDERVNDASRYKNRGGNLLKEERERNQLQKTLSALDYEIYCRIEAYESETGKKFLYFKDYRSHVLNKGQQRTNNKENIKHERHWILHTPNKQSKIVTPKSAPCKKNVGKLYCTPSVKPKVTSYTVKKPPIHRVKAIKKYKKDIFREIKQDSMKSSSNDTTYTEFINDLKPTSSHIFRYSVVASRKIGGTRITTPDKNRRTKKRSVTPNIDSDITSIRRNSGLPFFGSFLDEK